MAVSNPREVIRLHPSDPVGVALRDLQPGDELTVDGQTVRVADPVPLGHKIALAPIAKGKQVRKYGQTIGVTTQPVEPGQWVHSHNLTNDDLDLDHAPATEVPLPPQSLAGRVFQGYRRPSGRVGTRNYVAVISMVNCSASVSKYVTRRFDASALSAFPNIDGVIAFTHTSGCGMPFDTQAHHMLNRVLGGIANHPNIGGYLLVGLGCEQATPEHLLSSQRLVQIDGVSPGVSGVPVFSMQELGGTAKTVEVAVRKVAELLPRVNDVRRESMAASELILGLECGGSDGSSGITANPALGVSADQLVACGGTAVLSETPEIYGAEHLLTRRAISVEVAEKLIERIRWWKWYTGLFGAELDNNPSIGNKQGGLTTIAEKSLGAVAKGGSTALVEVYQYAQPVNARGLVFMDTPGYDPASVTGMVAGGANVVVFTTGRGSCFGCKPTPSIKVATNTPMFERMADDMDINAGEILQGRPLAEVGQAIFDEILAVASGKRTKSEQHGIGDEEFIPWTVGPML
jgi:altronate hydrolase